MVAAVIQKARSSWPIRFIEQFVQQWQDHRVGGLAAEIAFWGLLSVLPLLLVLLSVIGAVARWTGAGNDQDLERWVVDRASDVFGRTSDVVDLFSGLFDDIAANALTAGAIAALYTSSRGFKIVVQALDVVYGREHRRGYVGSRIVGLLLAAGTTIVGTFIVFLIVVGPLFGGSADLADSLGAGGWFSTLWTFVRYPAATIVLGAWLAYLYFIAPNHRAPYRWELPGAAVATMAMGIVTLGFRYFLVLMGGTNAIYGTLGVAISLLLWFYLLATGLLIGAEVNSVLADWYNIGEQRYQPKPIRTAFWWWWHRREADNGDDEPDPAGAGDELELRAHGDEEPTSDR